jgi:hypothetical protein
VIDLADELLYNKPKSDVNPNNLHDRILTTNEEKSFRQRGAKIQAAELRCLLQLRAAAGGLKQQGKNLLIGFDIRCDSGADS